MKILTPKFIREAVKTYNKNNPDDDLSFKEVHKQFQEDIEYATESLVEQMNQVKEKWYENNSNCSEFINVEVISAKDFAYEVFCSVRATAHLELLEYREEKN